MEIRQYDLKVKNIKEALKQLDDFIAIYERNTKKRPQRVTITKKNYDLLLKGFGAYPPSEMTRNKTLVRYIGQNDDPKTKDYPLLELEGYLYTERDMSKDLLLKSWITPRGQPLFIGSAMEIKGDRLKIIDIEKKGVRVTKWTHK